MGLVVLQLVYYCNTLLFIHTITHSHPELLSTTTSVFSLPLCSFIGTGGGKCPAHRHISSMFMQGRAYWLTFPTQLFKSRPGDLNQCHCYPLPIQKRFISLRESDRKAMVPFLPPAPHFPPQPHCRADVKFLHSPLPGNCSLAAFPGSGQWHSSQI